MEQAANLNHQTNYRWFNKYHRSTLIFTALLLINKPALPQKANLVKTGEIHRIDLVTRNIEVIVFDGRLIRFINEAESLRVIDQDDNEVGSLKVISYQLINKKHIFDCELITSRKTFFVGESVGIYIKKPEQPRRLSETQPEKSIIKEIIHQKDSSQMILIPEGAFLFGSDITGTDHYTTPIESELTEIQRTQGKKRILPLSLNAYYIDKYEISINQFRLFLRDTGVEPPPDFDIMQDSSLPVTNLSYPLANDYCTWAGKRLPTELEWEKAARGPGIISSMQTQDNIILMEKINVYPVGLEFDGNLCITKETSGKPVSIHELKDKSFYGLYGTCGNAAEWTSSWFIPYRGNTIQNENFGRKFKVIRSGAYNLPSRWTKGYERMIGGIPSLKDDYRAGVRCARDAN